MNYEMLYKILFACSLATASGLVVVLHYKIQDWKEKEENINNQWAESEMAKKRHIQRLEAEIVKRDKIIAKRDKVGKIGFCNECKDSHWSEYLNCYLCAGEEKTEFDFCSSFKPRDKESEA